MITLGKGIIQIYECSCEFSHIFLDLDASLHYIYINLYLRLEYIHTILSLQKVLVIYLCGFKNVDIIQLDKKLLFKTMLSIYTPWHVQN